MSKIVTYKQALLASMQQALAERDNTLLIGQGVTDFKSIFGTVEGLPEKYPNRVIETPISEDSVAGVSIGLALNGMYPINTHIRADFALLIFNQLVNLAAKYKYMFGGSFEVRCLFRLVIGRSWGQGAQHSQSLQSLLAHIPGLRVIMPATPNDILVGYKHAIFEHPGPVVSLEHRLAYDLEISDHENQDGSISSTVMVTGSDVTIVATSIMVLESVRAAQFLNEVGISCEVINLNCVSHPDTDLILRSVKKTGRLLVVDTSWKAFGVTAELCRLILETNPSLLKQPVKSLGMAPAPCPTAKALEDIYYPDMSDIVVKVYELLGLETDQKPVPTKKSMTDFYKHFRGPF